MTATDAASVTTAYEYDSRHRLTKACFAASSCTGASDWVSYVYDAVSNRLAEGRPAGTTTYTYNAADQLSSQSGLNGAKTFSYDARGNQAGAGSDTFAYNLADRMTSATASGTTTTYAYDGDGVRLDATSGAATTRFLWDVNDPLPLLALETDGSGGVERRYAYGHELLSMEDASGSYYFHGDHLGSVIEVTNASGATQWEYAYEPYGAARATTQVDPNAPANPMRFTGQYLDGTGLYHLRARQYDPGTGVFGGTDPWIQPPADPYVTRYSYANGRPGVLIDPSGLDTCGTDWNIGGLVDCVAKTDDVVRAGGNSAKTTATLAGAALGWGAAMAGEKIIGFVDRRVSQPVVNGVEFAAQGVANLAQNPFVQGCAVTGVTFGLRTRSWQGALLGCVVGAGLRELIGRTPTSPAGQPYGLIGSSSK